MQILRSAPCLSDLTRPLLSKFGENLTLFRDGDGVRWSYAGDSAVVEPHPSGALAVKFISHPMAEAGSGDPVRAVYVPHNPTYPLTRPGVARMVDDLAEFFSGTREPRFTFVDAFVEGFPG